MRSQSFPGLESRPEDCAEATTSVACAPLGIRDFPPTTTSRATLAGTCCPTLAFFELTDWSRVTVICVPAGISAARRDRGMATNKRATRRAIEIFLMLLPRQGLWSCQLHNPCRG